jgi:hypothetical protein
MTYSSLTNDMAQVWTIATAQTGCQETIKWRACISPPRGGRLYLSQAFIRHLTWARLTAPVHYVTLHDFRLEINRHHVYCLMVHEIEQEKSYGN